MDTETSTDSGMIAIAITLLCIALCGTGAAWCATNHYTRWRQHHPHGRRHLH